MADTTTTKSDYLAQPCGDCCSKGSIHEGEPKGIFESVAELRTYISKPAESKSNGHVLLYFSDVSGMSNNALGLMDSWAAAGYLAVGIDYFRGDSVSKHTDAKTGKPLIEGWNMQKWAMEHKAFADEAVPKWAPAVKEKYGKEGTRFACVGYCFGAPFVLDVLASGICNVGAFAHPAFLKNHHFEDLKKPLFLSCCDNDFTFDDEARNKAVQIMTEKKARYHLQLFSGVEHGFASRGNIMDPYQRWVKEQSFNGIVSFADFWLSQA